MDGWGEVAPTPIHLGRERLLDLDDALATEWLVANGLGGYASSTVLSANTRRYHGLLVAATNPPTGRRVLLAKVDGEIEVDDGERVALSTNEYHDGTISPTGYLHLEQFWLDGTLPHWRWRFRGAHLERALAMAHGENTVVLRYRLLAADAPLTLRLAPFVTDRGFHDLTKGWPDWRWIVEPRRSGAVVRGWADAARVGVFGVAAGGSPRWVDTGLWYWRFLYRAERARGLDDLEDLYTPGLLVYTLGPGETAWLVATTESHRLVEAAPLEPEALFEGERMRQRRIVATSGVGADASTARLALAADQFVVRRGGAASGGRTVIAGYHWFDDWGRDTAIALDGLCGATGRHDEVRAVLRTFAGYVDRGMLPNRFPEDGATPEYNSADAALWYVEAVARHLARTDDQGLLADLLPALDAIADGYYAGTRHGIGVDPTDGLLRAGAPGLQLTWMDARVGDWVVTPRRGKPVELEALWYNALQHLNGWHAALGHADRARELADWASRCRTSFNSRFWNEARGCCFDVVDADDLGGQPDGRVRPNQLFAVSLPHPVLAEQRWPSVVRLVEASLLTTYGIRTLAPDEPGYVGSYGGDVLARDGAYHQGPAWPWLLGAYVDAARRVRGASRDPSAVLDVILARLDRYGLGTIAELADGDLPNRPNGAIAQAWSVGELLRVLSPRSAVAGP